MNSPFGYDSTDHGYLIPIEDDLIKLLAIKEMLDEDNISMREAARYLSESCSRTISHVGLRKRLGRPVFLHDASNDELIDGQAS